MRRPGVQLQLALAVVAALASLTVGAGGPYAVPAVAMACASAVCWVARALVSDRVPKWVDLLLLAAMLLGSAVAAVPTNAVAVAPMVGSIVIVVGNALEPGWTRWVWPIAAVLACGAGFAIDPETGSGAVVAVILVLTLVAGSARRATWRERRRHLQHLEREHAAELEGIRVAVERVLTPERLRERFPALTAREADVLVLITHGHSNDEIAARLFISVSTVKSHVNAVFTKIPARDRAQAIALVLGTARPTSTPADDSDRGKQA